MKTYYVSSTLRDNNQYSNGIIIRGLSSIATGIKFLTPCKAVTTIDEQQFETLKNNPSFRKHEERGYITIADYPCEGTFEEALEQELIDEQAKEVLFKKVGRTNKHPVTLFEVFETPLTVEESFDPDNLKTVATYCFEQAHTHLKNSGFDDPQGHFLVVNGKIERWTEGKGSSINTMSLFAAILERDKNEQTGDFLAASIANELLAIDAALLDLKLNHDILSRDYMARQFYYVMNRILHIQNLSYRLTQLEKIQAYYSGGKGRSEAGEPMEAIYGKKAEKYYREYILAGHTQSNAYKLTSKKIRDDEKSPDVKTPSASTIEFWFKQRPDLKKKEIQKVSN